MQNQELADDGAYMVVVNQDEQYSIWPADRELPAGWCAAGLTGSRSACLEHIGKVWTDMRPLSVRKAVVSDALPQESKAKRASAT